MFKATMYRKAVCTHLSEADAAKCPLCSMPKRKAVKPKDTKYLTLYGYKIANVPQTMREALDLAARLKVAAKRRDRRAARKGSK